MNTMESKKTSKTETGREEYVSPAVISKGSLREITRECPEWQCSVTVPPPPEP